MPAYRPYSLTPGQRLDVESVQPDGARALVVGQRLDAVTDAAAGQALRIRISAERVEVLPAE